MSLLEMSFIACLHMTKLLNCTNQNYAGVRMIYVKNTGTQYVLPFSATTKLDNMPGILFS